MKGLSSLRRSIKRRLVLMFVLLALAAAGIFAFGAQRAFSVGWRDAARPLLVDYVDRLAAELVDSRGQPQVERARALTERMPVVVHIEGPVVTWNSHPQQTSRDRYERPPRGGGPTLPHVTQGPLDERLDGASMLVRTTADGHRISFGLNHDAFERKPRWFGGGLVALLLITLGAYLYVRRLLRPLDDIAAGAQRFGSGDFSVPIPVRHPQRPDELGQLATTVNTMGSDIRQMLEAKRALLLAISHELRSPLTRARLHAELLPEAGNTGAQREALLRDLQEMATLVSDLLESERLSGRHAVLQREPTDVVALARSVIAELVPRHPSAAAVAVHAAAGLPLIHLDPMRVRLLLRNLLDNALRHGANAPLPPELHLNSTPGSGLSLEVRDHGPGVPEDQLSQLAQAFYRPDAARTRVAGGVGLGLYLCRLVAQAHGGQLSLSSARPGLAVKVTLPEG